MKFYIHLAILLAILITFAACDSKLAKNDSDAVARVGDKIILRSDIPDIFPAGIQKSDSEQIVHTYLKAMIKMELLRNIAENNLTEEQVQQLEKKLNITRTSLLIYEYEQKMMDQRIDTTITEEELESYYANNQEKFTLENNIVKVLYIKLPVSAPNIEKLKIWYKSDKDEDLTKIESYCYQYATKFDDFNEEWVFFNELLKNIPYELNNQERFLKYNKNIEASDTSYLYLVHIRDYKTRSEISPLDFVSPKIKSIIFNKRKIEFIEELENNIYNDAISNNEFTIY